MLPYEFKSLASDLSRLINSLNDSYRGGGSPPIVAALTAYTQKQKAQTEYYKKRTELLSK